MKKTLFLIITVLFTAVQAHASQSTITEAEGHSCMGYDKSRKETETDAMVNAKRAAAEFVKSYIESETQIKNMELEKDLISAYTNAVIKIIQKLENTWYKDPSAGDCYKVRIKAEVVPDEKKMKRVKADKSFDDPSSPLNVRVWTDKEMYSLGDKVKIYLKGNKPFYGRLVYKDADGQYLQLLPNPFRSKNYFNGGVIYEMPSGEDNFELKVEPPFGKEKVIVYAGTSQLGELSLAPARGVYAVKRGSRGIGNAVRGLKIEGAGSGGGEKTAAEFSEAEAPLWIKKR